MSRRQSLERHWARRLLATYWPAMFLATHWPKLHLDSSVALFSNDKILHCGAYALLAALAGTVAWHRAESRRARLRGFLLVAVVIAAYGVFDEITQPLVMRSADLLDWCADLVGCAIGLATAAGWGWLRDRISAAPDLTAVEEPAA
ncbi:MAG: VanZ family protein [Pirellulales bacterium]|nr:VanZ family protein [Pirellulales bacterium]